MDLEEAQRRFSDRYLQVAERVLGCPVKIEGSYTREYEWGWLFMFVAIDPKACQRDYPHVQYAYDRCTGLGFPVGTKGLDFAVRTLMRLREKCASLQQGENLA